MRQPSDAVARYWRELAARPWRHDFYDVMRRVECLHADQPRLGQGLRPADEAIRLGQTPAVSFAPAPLSAFSLPTANAPARLEVRFFGLFGSQGPLPLHLTDLAHERLQARDPTFARFADLFHHRMLLLFYRAWAQAQPTVHADRPATDRFASYVGSLAGYGAPSMRSREPVPDAVRLHFAGRLMHRTRNAEGLAALLQGFFRRPVRIEEFVGHWMALPASERSRLGRPLGAGQQLGSGVVLGARVWDRQHKFRIAMGPLSAEQFEGLLPHGDSLPRLVALVRDYLCHELSWDLQLTLPAEQVPALRLGPRQRLGWSSWLGAGRQRQAPAAVTLTPERYPIRSAPSPAASQSLHTLSARSNA